MNKTWKEGKNDLGTLGNKKTRGQLRRWLSGESTCREVRTWFMDDLEKDAEVKATFTALCLGCLPSW